MSGGAAANIGDKRPPPSTCSAARMSRSRVAEAVDAALVAEPRAMWGGPAVTKRIQGAHGKQLCLMDRLLERPDGRTMLKLVVDRL